MSEVKSYIGQVVNTLTATIANTATKSDVIDLKGATLKTIIMPAAFTGTVISFEISTDGTNFFPYYNVDDIEVDVTVTAGRAYGLAAIDFYSIQYLKIVSNASEGAKRLLTLISRGF